MAKYNNEKLLNPMVVCDREITVGVYVQVEDLERFFYWVEHGLDEPCGVQVDFVQTQGSCQLNMSPSMMLRLVQQ